MPQYAQLSRLLYAVQHLKSAAIWHGAGSIPAAAKAGSLPPVKARRRKRDR
nr:MAG TPA: hypothetical protein [Bacteriophage sp.]